MKSIVKITANFILISLVFLLSCTTDDSISSLTRTNFLGQWKVTENQKKTYYEVTINADPNEGSRVLIYNFAGLGPNVVATAVISGSSITLDADQNLANITVNGGGTMTGTTTMNWTYSLFDGADLVNYTAVFTKK